MSRRSFRIGIDVGGTFTKAALIDHASHAVVGRASVPTTHRHPEGVAAGVIAAFKQVLADAAADPDDVVFLAHSTTQATNALLEGDVAPVGIVGMAGARAAALAAPQSNIGTIELAPGRRLKTSHQFLVTDGIEAPAIERAIDALVTDGAEVLVASSAFGVDDTSMEELVRALGRDRGLPTTCGHEITRLYGLATRTRTAVINASILPRMIATADMTEASVKATGIDAPLMIMRGDGGVMDIHEMRRRPAMTMLSGPAASVAGALMHVRMSDGIYFEVGGTSTNLGVIKGGRPAVTYASVGGHATYVSSLDVRVLGVAGGSLIRLDENGAADVGPRSAHIAGLAYACFANPAGFEGATLAHFSDGHDYLVVEATHGRFALTTTCAANALGLTTPDMHCHAPPAAARAAFAPLAARLGTDVDGAARAVLAAAAAKIVPVVESLIKEYRLDADQRVLIGEGGGVGALLPFVAGAMGLRYEISPDAEIISSIGAALAMVREVIERLIPHPTPDDLAAVRAEALSAVTRLGADPATVDVAIEVDQHTGQVRATATGSAALRVRTARSNIREPAARAIAAASFGQAADRLKLIGSTRGSFVYGLDQSDARSIRVIDWEGTVRVQRSHARLTPGTAGDWPALLSRIAGGRDFPGAVLLVDRHIIDLTGLATLSQASEIVRAEIASAPPDTPLLFITFDASPAG